MQSVNNQDPGDDGYNWVMTECGCAVSCVAKHGSSSDIGRVGHRRSDGNGRTTGAGGALYSATEARPRFRQVPTRHAWLTGLEKSEPAFGEQT